MKYRRTDKGQPLASVTVYAIIQFKLLHRSMLEYIRFVCNLTFNSIHILAHFGCAIEFTLAILYCPITGCLSNGIHYGRGERHYIWSVVLVALGTVFLNDLLFSIGPKPSAVVAGIFQKYIIVDAIYMPTQESINTASLFLYAYAILTLCTLCRTHINTNNDNHHDSKQNKCHCK